MKSFLLETRLKQIMKANKLLPLLLILIRLLLIHVTNLITDITLILIHN